MTRIEHRRILATTVLAASLLIPLSGCAKQDEQAPKSSQLQVERLSGETTSIIPTDAKLNLLTSGYTWVEGPVWYQNQLLFSDIPDNTIYSWTAKSGAKVFAKDTGYLGKTPFKGHEPGSNGMAVDGNGHLTIAAHARRQVYRLNGDAYNDGLTVLADQYQGKALNSPNDLTYKSDGSLYFTDPPYGLETQSDKDPKKQLKANGVYRIANAAQQSANRTPDHSALQLVVSDLPRPNGVIFSPDEKYLYVSNSEPQKIWMRYRVQADGSVTDGKVFFDATKDPRVGNPDGMAVDEEGHLYAAAPGGVWIFSPEGEHLVTLDIPEKVGNVTFGGEDYKTLFITASDKVYSVQVSIPGVH